MKRWAKLTALAVLAAMLLTGCVGLPGIDASDDPETPAETQPPLTEPMYEDRDALYQYYNQVGIGDTLEAVTYCQDCGKTYPTMKYAKICPYCGSGQTYLVRGNEYIIKEIEAM